MLNCKCACGTNTTIVPIPSCPQCKISLCLAVAAGNNASLPSRPEFRCAPTADTALDALCFDRESRKDELLVSTFLIVLLGLVVSATFKPCLTSMWNKLRGQRIHSAYSRFLDSD
ncbi:hypothetical protein H9P43_007243 [Blastocladiella emersonii ATCC 22665]|nr:hypothetical protein H9P43_007243 [Blastocladiella emersonii ATCC 22665]